MALTFGMGIAIAVLAAVAPLSEIVKLVNIGTLFAFFLVNIGVIILRRTHPDMERPFRVPFVPVFPIIGCGLILYLMYKLPGETWWRFVIWLVIGLVDLLLLRPQALAAADRAPDGRAAMSIVVGHDGSDSGDDAAALGAQLARATGEGLVVVTVYPQENPIGAAGSTPSGSPTCASRRDEVSAGAQRFLEERGVDGGVPRVGSRSAAHGLDDIAEAEHASMIVVGS